MLFVTLGLLLGGAVLLWCFVLTLTFADGDSEEQLDSVCACPPPS